MAYLITPEIVSNVAVNVYLQKLNFKAHVIESVACIQVQPDTALFLTKARDEENYWYYLFSGPYLAGKLILHPDFLGFVNAKIAADPALLQAEAEKRYKDYVAQKT